MALHDDGDPFVALSATRRAAALIVGRRVAARYGARVVFEELPASAPLAPACVLKSPSGVPVALVSSNGVATSVLVGPGEDLMQLPDQLDERSRTELLESTLRAALNEWLGAS